MPTDATTSADAETAQQQVRKRGCRPIRSQCLHRALLETGRALSKALTRPASHRPRPSGSPGGARAQDQSVQKAFAHTACKLRRGSPHPAPCASHPHDTDMAPGSCEAEPRPLPMGLRWESSGGPRFVDHQDGRRFGGPSLSLNVRFDERDGSTLNILRRDGAHIPAGRWPGGNSRPSMLNAYYCVARERRVFASGPPACTSDAAAPLISCLEKGRSLRRRVLQAAATTPSSGRDPS